MVSAACEIPGYCCETAYAKLQTCYYNYRVVNIVNVINIYMSADN